MISVEHVIRLLEEDPYGFTPNGREYLRHSIGIELYFPPGFPGKISVNGVWLGYWESRSLIRSLRKRSGVIIDAHIQQIRIQKLERALEALDELE